MKLTIVIPTYSDFQRGWCDMAAENAKEWKKHCDELIVSEDGVYCPKLHEIADLYILHSRLWTADNANVGWQAALSRGADYVCLMDSDVKYFSGDLRDLCITNSVGAPTVIQHPDNPSVAPMLCVPKEVTDLIGMYDSRNGKHGLYHFDGDFQARLIQHQIPLVGVKSVKIDHVGGATTQHISERP